MSKLKKKPIVLFIAALIVLYVIIYIVPRVTGALVSSYTIGYGELKIYDETDAYLVREEKVYTAAHGGKANRYIEDGTLVRTGTTIMEITGSSDDEVGAKYSDILGRLGKEAVSTSDCSILGGGVISYYADGFESKIRPDNMEKGSYDFYSKLKQDDVLDLKRSSIAKGEPVFKVVDRTKWYMVCYVDKEHADRYHKGAEVKAEFEDDYVMANVLSVRKEKKGGLVRVILETDHYYDKYAQMRVCPVSLVTYEERGLIIENGSIGKVKGVPGVYVRNKTNDYNFVPIKVMASDGKYSLVADTSFVDEKGNMQSTVEIYDEILKEPK